MKVLIGAIGTNSYENVEYQFADGERLPARYFIVSLAKKIGAEKVFVLLTEDAKTLQWEYKDGSGLEAEFKKHHVDAEPIDIPKGLNEEEAWTIFSIIADTIPEGAEVTLDITHGLRSIPFLLLLSINYLKSIKNAQIADIYYGALDAVGRDNPIKPAYSLGNFATLLDWSIGVDNFKRSGDLDVLAGLLDERQTRLRRAAPSDNDLPTKLKSVSRWLRKVSAALDLTRPDEVMESSAQLITEIDQAKSEIPKWAQPFSILLSQITDALQPMSLADPRKEENIEENLRRQLTIIEWYGVKRRYQSAIILLREWFTSWKMNQNGVSSIFDRDQREKADKAWFEQKDGHLGELQDLRNDVAHAGMRQNPDQSDALKRRFEKALARTREITKLP